jgi:hypothetical protein
MQRFRQKTLENRLEDWGFTLNPEIRPLLKADLRKRVADLLKVDCKTPFPLGSQHLNELSTPHEYLP